jgi:hypothetical protein
VALLLVIGVSPGVPASPSGGGSADGHVFCRVVLDAYQGTASAALLSRLGAALWHSAAARAGRPRCFAHRLINSRFSTVSGAVFVRPRHGEASPEP